MLDQTIEQIACDLDQAESTRRQLRLISCTNPGITIEEAYAIQSSWIDMKIKRGRKMLGRKVGLTSKAMLNQSTVTEPDYGVLLDDMFFEDGARIAADRFVMPLIECEIAFILGKRLAGPGVTIYDALNATDYVVPALELVDLRVPRTDKESGAPRKITDTVADNAGSAAVIMGGRPMKPDAVDLRWVPVLCYRNGLIEESGVSAGVMNHPANSIAWLANKLAPHGVALEPGQVILSGSFTRTVPVRAGDSFHADFKDMGSISCVFT